MAVRNAQTQDGPVRRHLRRRPAGRGRSPWVELTPPAKVAVAVGVLFFVITVVWISLNDRVPDGDNGKHLGIAFGYHDNFAAGEFLGPLSAPSEYPPFLHIVGAVGAFIGGVSPKTLVITENLVFVPLLVAGCYGAGRVAYDRRAGVLAAVVALGSPMLIGQFHVFMLDAPLAALTAAAVWLLLASDGFKDRRYAIAAGVVVALGMLTKQVFFFFVAGLVLTMLLRSGWRQWRGFLLFCLPTVLLAAPWYLDHLTRVQELTQGATGQGAAGTSYVLPVRWSLNNFMWYVWNFLNVQVLVPVMLFLAAGLISTVVAWVRRRPTSRYAPELIVGGAVGFLAMTYLTLKDSRYTLPLLVYVSVLGTGWLSALPRRAWTVGAVTIALIAAMNTVAVNLRVGEPVRLALPHSTSEGGVFDREFWFYRPDGYGSNKPFRDGITTVMRSARRDGFTSVQFEGSQTNGFNVGGAAILARTSGIDVAAYDPLRNKGTQISFVPREPFPGEPPPCTITADDRPIMVVVGAPAQPRPQRIYCPISSDAVAERYGAPGRSNIAVPRKRP